MPLLLGVGNRWRGDDGIGPAVAERVLRLGIPGLQVVVETEPLALLEHLEGQSTVVVVDATNPGPDPGRVRVWRLGPNRLARREQVVGSHGLGVADAVELARSLGLLPSALTVIGVEAQSSQMGAGLSRSVHARLEDAVAAVVSELTAPTS
jgi:hydrogenase maturation protease